MVHKDFDESETDATLCAYCLWQLLTEHKLRIKSSYLGISQMTLY